MKTHPHALLLYLACLVLALWERIGPEPGEQTETLFALALSLAPVFGN